MTKLHNEDPRVVAIRNDLVDTEDPRTHKLYPEHGHFGPMFDSGYWTEHMAVGRGSCSYIDECYSDEDLVEFLDEGGLGGKRPIRSPKSAVKAARRLACLLWNRE